MAPSARRLVRTSVGIAAVVPALGLLVLAVSMVLSGGFGGVLAGLTVGVIALALLGAAFVMTHAPVSIAAYLRRTEQEDEPEAQQRTDGSNGHGPGGSNGRG